MATTTELFDWQLQVLQPKQLPSLTDKDQLTPITFTLYPIEVLTAAQQALGSKTLTPYAVELYEFAVQCKDKGSLIKASQLSGVLYTQAKLDKWLASVSHKTLLSTGVSEAVFMAYAQFHKARVDESEAVLQKLRKLAGVQ
jgi:hypothetical protein